MTTHLRPAHGGDRPDVVAELLRDQVLLAIGEADGDVELAGALTAIRRLGAGPVPRPSTELEARFDATVPSSLAGRQLSRRTRVIVGTVVASMSAVGLTGVAAASNQLPAGPQQVVTRVINDLTPFTIGPGRSTPLPHPPVAPRNIGGVRATPMPPSSEPADTPDASTPGGPADTGGFPTSAGDSSSESAPSSAPNEDGPTPDRSVSGSEDEPAPGAGPAPNPTTDHSRDN
jgi:hypothetical protein